MLAFCYHIGDSAPCEHKDCATSAFEQIQAACMGTSDAITYSSNTALYTVDMQKKEIVASVRLISSSVLILVTCAG